MLWGLHIPAVVDPTIYKCMGDHGIWYDGGNEKFGKQETYQNQKISKMVRGCSRSISKDQDLTFVQPSTIVLWAKWNDDDDDDDDDEKLGGAIWKVNTQSWKRFLSKYMKHFIKVDFCPI